MTTTEDEELDDAFRQLMEWEPEPDEPTEYDLAPQLRWPAHRINKDE